jgi:hypothetical protein
LGTSLTTCAQRGTSIGGFVNGDTVELRVLNGGGSEVAYNAQAGTTCPAATGTFCGSYYTFTQASMNSLAAINVVVSVGSFTIC